MHGTQINVCFKKIWTNYSTVSLLWFVQVFLKQTLCLFPYKVNAPVIIVSAWLSNHNLWEMEKKHKCLTCIQFLQHKTQSDYAIAQNLFGICDHWWEQIQNDRRIEIGDLFWQCWLIGAWRPEIWDIDIGFSVDFLTPNSIPNINQRLLKYFILYNFHIFIKIIQK